MYTNYFDGFTEALVRNLRDPRYKVATTTVTYEPEGVFARDLRLGWPGRFRATVVTCETRGVLLLDELHVPLASEVAAALERLSNVELLVRETFPHELTDTDLLSHAVVVYGDDWDIEPSDGRVAIVVDEETPETTLRVLFDAQLPEVADSDEVEQLRTSLYSEWETYGREDWLEHYDVDDAA